MKDTDIARPFGRTGTNRGLPRRRVLQAAAGIPLLAACSTEQGVEDPTAGGSNGGESRTLTLGMNGDVSSWDPAELPNAEITNIYRHAVYDTLLERSADGREVIGNLAKTWEYSEGNTLLTMELQDGVTFSDGESLDAEAVKLSFDRTAEKNSNLSAIESATVIDEHTIEFRLTEPSPTILDILTTKPSIVSPAALEDLTELAVNPVGSGPYLLDRDASTPEVSYTFVRNPDYWNAENSPYLFDEIVMNPMPDIAARLNALRSGQINAGGVDAASAPAIESAGLDLYRTPSMYFGLILGDRDGELLPPLADVRVRQAINHAIDRQGLVDSIIGGYGRPSSQMAGPSSPIPLYVEELDDRYPYDPDRARELLADAGYPDGFELELPSQGPVSAADPALVELLGAIGIDATLENIPPDRGVEVREGQFPMWVLQGQFGNLWTNEFPVDGVWNPFGSTTPELSEMMSAAGAAQSEEERTAAFQDVERFMVEEAWFAPFYHRETLYGADETVQVSTEYGESFPLLSHFQPAG
ncbi:ABC transporter substrate-binding protein [Ruania alba]|uniref:Peptide/nickel transport system substrate-binding protein n=1 Tax=Ruania alba TaxID=648782 RepID=A0A1H5N6D1_9MICO|nr:ABC transporter substrate-binding protein [Ruania alba]SEE97104.1 peptide/nickel transport system substrate-binding protein [Ruania alba]